MHLQNAAEQALREAAAEIPAQVCERVHARLADAGLAKAGLPPIKLLSENASRLVAMQRADKNIDELLKDLDITFHRLRQSGIDEELFDVISGFETLSSDEKR